MPIWLEIIITVIALLGTFASYYIWVRKQMAEHAEVAIGSAETKGGTGEEKFQFACDLVTSLIPVVARPFIPRSVVESVVQAVFDRINIYAQNANKHASNE